MQGSKAPFNRPSIPLGTSRNHIYERHLSSFRGRAPVVVEIGVRHGGSLNMWREYFGPGTMIHGIDTDARCQRFEEKDVRIHLADQADPAFWAAFRTMVPRVDIVIDDGGHHMKQQRVAHHEMFPHLSVGGVYVCEDVQTSYWREYNGGFRKPDTFVEFAKRLVDCINAWHSRDENSFRINDITTMLSGLHFYNNMIVFERGHVERSEPRETGSIRI